MYKMTIAVPGGTMEVPAQTLKELIKLTSFLQGLPRICPVDDTPTRLSYRMLKFDNYGLASTGTPVYYLDFGIPTKGDEEFFLGKHKDGETKVRWTHYDHATDKTTVMWEDGKLTAEGQKARGRASNGKEAIAQHSNGSDKLVEYAEQELQGIQLKPAGYVSPVIELRKQVNLLGEAYYAEDWYEASQHNVGRMTNGKYSDIDDLTAEELTRMIAGLNQLKAKAKV
jgi:hypothetical protein